ncbi:MAG: PilZ domain-containing protein, partial [Candidatus Omnitrophota bacterium]
MIAILCGTILGVMLISVLLDEKKRRERDTHLVKLKGYWDGRNRRTSDRLNINLQVKYSTGGKITHTKSMDISARGIRLLLEEKIEKNTPIRLEIHLPNQERTVKTNGEVAWTQE